MANYGVGSVKLPPDFDLQAQNAASEWKFWKTSFEDYLIATGQHEAVDKIKLSMLRNIIGTESARIMSTFNVPDEELDKYKYTIELIDKYVNPRVNECFERYNFLKRSQKEGESFEHFLTECRHLVKSCNYNVIDPNQSAEDKSLRDKIVMGIIDPVTREALLRIDQLTLDKAVQFCRTSEQSAGVTILPSETIDVIEGGEYTFGLKDDNETNFCNCDYKSNLDNSWTTFHVNKPYNACIEVEVTPPGGVENLNKIQRASENNIIKDYGNIAWCQVNVKKVDDQGPSEWSLKPDDWNNTFKEQVNFKINFFYAVPLNSEISIFEGENFFQYLNTSLTFESCSLTFNGTTKNLNLKAEEAVVLTTDSKIDQKQPERIYSLGRDLCGFKLNNAGLADKFDWTLTGVTNDKKKYRAVFRPIISPNIADSILHKEIVIQVGSKDKMITCKSKDSGVVERVNFCKLYNPKGDLVLTKDKLSNGDCSYTINTFQVENYGVWRCFTGNTNTMKSVLYTFKFIEKKSPYMFSWVKEKKDYLNIGCQLRNPKYSSGFDYCKMTSPDQQFYSLTAGSATERYLAIGTDFKNHICEMEIKLPLEKNEIGMWRCESDRGGIFINVSSKAIVDYKKYSKLTTRIGKDLLILCEVPYYSSFCHIKSPNGTRYISKEKEESWLGRCSHEIKKVDVYDNGTWTCSFAQTTGMPDEEIAVEVTIADVLSYDPEVKTTEDYSAFMLCNAGGLPLHYCQFIDPNGKSYYIDNTVNSSYLSYYGKGTEYGECGIKITKVAKSDAGTWSCVVQLINEDNEISARISVEVSPNLLSGSNIVLGLGLTVGIVAITSLFIIIGFRTIRQRRRGQLEIARTASLRDSIRSDDQEDIFSVGGAPRSYDNPQVVRDDNHEHQY